MRLPVTLLALAIANSASASEDLATQLDVVAPLIQSQDYASLGGPDTHEGLVAGLEGRWFTLNTTARNWGSDGVEDREALMRSIERTCSDTWENIVTYSVTGPDSFRVEQRSPDGQDNGTFEMHAVPDTERRFTAEMDDQYILEIYGMTDASPIRQSALLDDMRGRLAEGVDLFKPTPDLTVNVSSYETEVWGRCPEL